MAIVAAGQNPGGGAPISLSALATQLINTKREATPAEALRFIDAMLAAPFDPRAKTAERWGRHYGLVGAQDPDQPGTFAGGAQIVSVVAHTVKHTAMGDLKAGTTSADYFLGIQSVLAAVRADRVAQPLAAHPMVIIGENLDQIMCVAFKKLAGDGQPATCMVPTRRQGTAAIFYRVQDNEIVSAYMVPDGEAGYSSVTRLWPKGRYRKI